jgi:ubiquitin C-terminal hydrolase
MKKMGIISSNEIYDGYKNNEKQKNKGKDKAKSMNKYNNPYYLMNNYGQTNANGSKMTNKIIISGKANSNTNGSNSKKFGETNEGNKERKEKKEKIEKKEHYDYKNKNNVENVENSTQQIFVGDTYVDTKPNKNDYSSPYKNNGYVYSSSIEYQLNNDKNNYDNNYSYYNNYGKYYNSNQYNESYNSNEYNNNTSGGYSLSYYYRNNLDRYDYSLETNTNNYQSNKIYCGIKGLSNNGNNCFLNATIQCLKHCFIFTKYIINESLSSYGVFGSYKTLIENMCKKNASSPNVLDLKKAMVKYNNIYSDHEQHDSTIFFNDLLNALNEELIEEKSFDGDEYDDISNDDEFQIKYTKHITKSKINEYFSFFIKEKTIFDCGEKMVDYQEYYYLDLPIFDENNTKLLTLEEALKEYTKKGYDYGKNAFICNKHQKKETSYNQNIFVSLPEILVISLKRVVNGKHVDHYVHYKERIEMSDYVENILGQSTRYELFAEVLHYGGAYGGHKVAICKNFNTNSWYLFNDSSVTIKKEIITSNAFLLFYKRI